MSKHLQKNYFSKDIINLSIFLRSENISGRIKQTQSSETRNIEAPLQFGTHTRLNRVKF